MNVATKELLTRFFYAAVEAADPASAIRRYIPSRPNGRTFVIGAGKAASQMAAAFEDVWDGPLRGLVVTRHGYGAACKRIEVVEAGHPVPDMAGQQAAQRLLSLVEGLTPDDLVVALISGGGSALLASPPPGTTLDDEIALNEQLLRSGAPIAVMNIVRKHVSCIKGGRLAINAYPAKVVTLCVSDIPGDDPSLIASGPTVPGPGSRQDALEAVATYGLTLPASVMRHLTSPAADAPATDDSRFDRNEVHVIASPSMSLAAAARSAETYGIPVRILSDTIEGEAKDIGTMHAAIAREIAARDQPFTRPVLLLSGGETTVTFPPSAGLGRGGRNSEFLLSFALGIVGAENIDALAADTDGIDGSQTNAGAFANGSSVERMLKKGLNPKTLLSVHDSWAAFAAIGDLFETGPTGTNVNDFRAVLIR